jgi:hypothetical protein
MYGYTTVIKCTLVPLLSHHFCIPNLRFYRVEIIAFTAVNNGVTSS